jgi:metal-sulfur cluster biosynthetic enzyme
MEMIVDDVRERLLREDDVDTVNVDIVWHPIWTKERLSGERKGRVEGVGYFDDGYVEFASI